MSIFDLKNIANQRVSCETCTEVVLRPFEGFCVLLARLAVQILEVLEKTDVGLFALVNLVETLRVGHALDYAAVGPSCKDFVGFEPDRNVLDLKNLIDL